MKRNGLLFQIVWLVLICGPTDWAQGAELYNFYDGVRGLGMGGVQIPTVNDETALLINPAALGKLRDTFVTIADPEVEINNLTAKTLVETHGPGAFTDPQELVDALQLHQDQHYHSRLQLFPSFVLPNFGIGVFGIQTQDAENYSSTGQIHLDYRRDVGAALGYNFRFWDGRIKLGTAARYFNRTEANIDVSATTTGLQMDQIANDGSALAVDGGLILSAPIRWLPSISGVVHDIGGTEFSIGSGLSYPLNPAPSSVRQSVDVGASVFPILTNSIRMTVAVELRDITNPSDNERDHSDRRLHGGVEINIADFLFVRGGWNQRYWTAGMELTTRILQFQVASYGEDIGTPGSPREDRRYVLKTSFRF